MRTTTAFLLPLAATLAMAAFQCEPAFRSKFCPQAINAGAEQCLTCAFEKFDAMTGLGCDREIIQTACNATNDQWTTAVSPYMKNSNTDCHTHNHDCNACLHDESFYTHECEFCYEDRKCYGVGGGGCSDDVGNYACTSKSDYSSCHCPPSQYDDDDSYTCTESDCPSPGADTSIECEFCEYMAGYLIGEGGSAVCDTLCEACCEEIPIIGPETCEEVLKITGGCAALEKEIEKLAGDATPCNVCSGLGMCDNCAPSSLPAPWLKFNTTYATNLRRQKMTKQILAFLRARKAREASNATVVATE